jgi:predicted TIM-barrel fold metal-dependent hydrolase
MFVLDRINKEQVSSLLRFAKEGIPLKDDLIIDSHSHIGGYYSDFSIPYNNPKNYIEHMDRLGIDKICAFSYAGMNSDFRYGNDEVIKAVKDYPNRIIGFVFLNLNYPHEWIPELIRCGKHGLTRGIKLYGEFFGGFQGKNTKEAKLEPVFRYANDHNMIMISHLWGEKFGEQEYLEEIAEEYPNICFILGHGTYWGYMYADVLRKKNNVYLCTAVS